MSEALASVTPLRPAADLERIQPAANRAASPVLAPLRRLAGAALILALWTVSTQFRWIGPDLLPGPGMVIDAFRELFRTGQLQDALAASLFRVVLGGAIGIGGGILAALFAGLLRMGEDLIDAPIQMMRTLPWAGLIPLLIIWLGIGEASKIALVALASFFPIYFNLFAGVRNVDQALVEAARTLKLSPAEIVVHVILPGALPSALVGLRYALGSAWLALVFAETVNSQSGLGYLITYARETYRTDIVVVCLLIYAALGLLADLMVRFIEGKLLAWRSNFKAV